MRAAPFDIIKKSLSEQIPQNALLEIPEKWEKIGDVVTIRLPDDLLQYQECIGKAYAEVLGCKTTLNSRGKISGVYREPQVTIIYGSPETETKHSENGIRFLLDPQKIMFSSGNLQERRRMATISNARETVVDLFAGIGYFTLPMAVYSQPRKIYACELNPLSYQYLCKNIVFNHVTKIVEPLFGDNRKTAPKQCAQRVILGYIKETHRFLPVAFECLQNHTGIIHYHGVFPSKATPDKPLQYVQRVAQKYKRSVTLVEWRSIKSYAPGIDHVVLDVQIGE